MVSKETLYDSFDHKNENKFTSAFAKIIFFDLKRQLISKRIQVNINAFDFNQYSLNFTFIIIISFRLLVLFQASRWKSGFLTLLNNELILDKMITPYQQNLETLCWIQTQVSLLTHLQGLSHPIAIAGLVLPDKILFHNQLSLLNQIHFLHLSSWVC